MTSLDKKVTELENHQQRESFGGFEIILVETREQHEHPERFEQVLTDENDGTGFWKDRMYRLKRKR